jgi:hypothetical protein
MTQPGHSGRAFSCPGINQTNPRKETQHMAIKLISNYAKRLGLPGYSSHQFSISVETELTDLGQVQGETVRLYGLLQDAVDREMQNTGYVPNDHYGESKTNGSGNSNGPAQHNAGPSNPGNNGGGDSGRWSCSDKQKSLILKLVGEYQLDRNYIDELATERFGVGVRQLNKLQASGLIDELFEIGNRTKGKAGNNNGQHHQLPAGKGGGR